MQIHIVVDDTPDGKITDAIKGAFTDKRIANAVAYHPYTPLVVIDVEVDKINDEELPTGTLMYGPHSRSCGIEPHEHGTVCGYDCPTCGGQEVNTKDL